MSDEHQDQFTILQAVKTQKTTNYKYPNWKLEYITVCLTNTEFGVCSSDRKTFTALSGANCICKLCCYNQQSQSTYTIHTHIPNKFDLIQMLAKSFQKHLPNFNSCQYIS
jgi:hypothetical protein